MNLHLRVKIQGEGTAVELVEIASEGSLLGSFVYCCPETKPAILSPAEDGPRRRIRRASAVVGEPEAGEAR